MSYQVLARKYRPQRFEDVVSQEHITRALANAVASGRLAHAILLSGPRGTGKTTIARILAKCVNCESGPGATPCNVCRSCQDITSGHAADVFEIDGASNNKVENVREIRDNAHYMPAHSPFKIYIIDEVHMLSDSAFNALLKILEEPPAHVKFFFATTDPNKIPITILSRCQRHDCRRVPLDAIIRHMAMLCEKEGIVISPEALTMIGREADGSIRDALSLLDLIITSADGPIGAERVSDILGGLDRQSLFDMSAAVFAQDAAKILEIIDRLYDRGQNMAKLFAEFLAHFRNLLVVKIGGTEDVLSDVSEFEINALRDQVKPFSSTHINQILDILFKEDYTIRQSSRPKLAMEMAFIRAIQVPPALSIDTLIEKIDALQKGFGQTPSDNAGLQPSNVTDPVNRMPGPMPSVEKSIPDYPTASFEKQPHPHEVNENQPPAAINTDPTDQLRYMNVPGESLAASWEKILKNLAGENPALSACFADSQLIQAGENQLKVQFSTNQFNINYAGRTTSQAIIQKTCSQYFGNDIEVSLAGTVPAAASANRNQNARLLENETLGHPLVEAAMKIFNGKIVEIKILQET